MLSFLKLYDVETPHLVFEVAAVADSTSLSISVNPDMDASNFKLNTYVSLEFHGGKPILYVWTDADGEKPTHMIELPFDSLLPRFTGRLYYEDGDAIRPLKEFDVHAKNKGQATKKVMDMYWDSRLDSSCCRPVFVFDDPD